MPKFFVSFILITASALSHASSGYCVFQQLERGTPQTVKIYDIKDQPCVVTREDGRNIRLEDEATRKVRQPATCAANNCTRRTEYFVGDGDPFIVIFSSGSKT